MCFSNTENFPYPRRNGFSTDQPVLPIVILDKREVTCNPSGILPEKVQYASNKPSNKKRAKINNGIRINVNLMRKITQSICLATRYGNGNSTMMLKKKVLIINT